MAEINNRNKLSQKKSNWFENKLKPIVQFLIYLRVPLTIAVASWYLFTQTEIEQTIEIYRVIALDNNVAQAVFTTVFVVLLSLGVWFSARLLERDYEKHFPEFYKPEFEWLYKNLPRVLGIWPLVSLAYGIWTTNKTLQNISETRPNVSDAKDFLWWWMISDLVLSASLFCLFFFRIYFFKQFENSNNLKGLSSLASDHKGDGLFNKKFEIIFVNSACFVFSLLSLPMIVAAKNSPLSVGLIAIILLIVFFNVGLFSWQTTRKSRNTVVWTCLISLVGSLALGLILPPTLLPDMLGSISVVAISLTILVVVFSTIYDWGLQNKIPGITILIVLICFSSAFNWNDNHRFRQFSKPGKSAFQL